MKAVTVIHAIDGKASFKCVYEDSSAYWLDCDTNKMVPVTSITFPDDVPTTAGIVNKFFEIQ